MRYVLIYIAIAIVVAMFVLSIGWIMDLWTHVPVNYEEVWPLIKNGV